MATWVLLAVAAQAIMAAVAVIDKYIVSGERAVFRPFVYAFYSCLISGSWVLVYLLGLLLPFSFFGFSIPSFFNVNPPSLTVVGLSLIAAYAFFVALVSLFKSFRHAEASDVVPVVGAVSAVVSLGLSYVFLETSVSQNFLLGIMFLVLGTFLVSRYQFNLETALTAIHAGIFFAIHFVAIKGVFNMTSFDDGFFWSRVAFVVIAFSMLLVPRYLKMITTQTKSAGTRGGILVVGNKLLAAVNTVLILKATELGDVSVVQALGGLQFVFILVITVFLSRRIPVTCADNITCDQDIYRKVIFVSLIVIGFFMLFT